MQKFLKIKGRDIEYTLKISKRSKSIRLSIYPGGMVIVSVPRFVPQFIVDRFLKDKADWIIEKIEKLSKIKVITRKSKKQQKDEYLKYKNIALKIVIDRLEYFNLFYNFKYNKITIRNQKTRWGSCSKRGNLNFSYKIALLPPKTADYIIVHELCHIGEFNHSREFWNLVASEMPDYKEIRIGLKQNKLKLD